MRQLLLLTALLFPLVAAHAQGNPVTNDSFEALDAEGKLADWELLGQGEIVGTAHSGQKALLLDRTEDAKGETGLNRRWKINSGEQGAMLADLKGGLEFWYQAPAMGDDTRMVVGVIPMSEAPLEGTGSGRVMYSVPRSHAGDKQWHRGLLKYDFTDNDKVKWVHVAARITGGPGQLLLDDIQWVPSVGPLPQVDQITLTETPGKAGEECTVKARIRNVGDQPMQAAQAVLALPPGLKATPGNTQTAPATAPDGIVYVQWTVTGPRDKPAALTVRLTSGEQVAEHRLDLASKLVVEQLRADRFLLAPEERTRLRLFVRNEGNVAVKGLTARLADTPAVADRAPRTLALLRPGETAAVEWMASLAKLSPSVPVTAEVLDGQAVVGQGVTELICAPAMPVVRNQKPGAYAQAWDNGAVIGNDSLRLVFAVDAQKAVGPGWLQVSRNGAWQTVAVLPRLGSIATKPAGEGGGLREVGAAVARASGDGKAATLVLNGKGIYEFRIATGADTLEYSMSLATDTRPVYGMHGPMLYVGEGTWGSRKTEAILPGLEWLTPDEESSSTLDIAANMPQRWRWCPPPHAVTIPCMSVNFDGVTVGLMWDQLQKIVGDETRPRAVFGAPDRFEGRNACLLGLMAPGGADPEWWIPPRLATEKPWDVQPAQVLTLHARLYAKTGATDALTALDRWFALYGAPQPERLPHGRNWKDEIGFSARGYLDSLWEPKTQKWFGSLNGPNMMAGLGWHAPYLYDVVYASRLAPDAATRQACTERAALVERLSGRKPVADDMGFEFADPMAALIGLGDQVGGLIRSQGDDGSWRFHARIEKSGIFAGMDYGELGPDQAAEVGTCAQTAYTILRYARMTGDPQATAAGLKALEFMNQFTVPRAAQVWEVPVHTPDVLASADACEAYLEAYQITGDKALLEKAVFWARTGIMFNYMWDVPGYEALRYASIPVLGASWYTCNWFGQPVQWNGLRLARAYTKLQAHDQSYPWRQMAEGLAISGMWQQHGAQVAGSGTNPPTRDMWPDHNDKWIALWPDNFHSVNLRRCPWVFAPRQILDLVYRFEGLHPSPETATVGPAGRQIRLNACAAIRDAKLQGETLTATIQTTPPQTSQIVVCNLAKPQGVRLNGAALAETPRVANTDGTGWEYSPTCKALLIKPGAGPTLKLEIAGARFEPGRMTVETATKLDFGFDGGDEGWRAVHDLSAPVVRDGVVTMTTTANDPYFIRTSLDIPADDAKTVVIRMAVPAGAQGELQVFWTTAASPNFDEAKSARLPLVFDGQMHDYAFKLSAHPLWGGQRLTGFRIDPGSGPAGVEVRIDSVKAR